MLVVIVLTPVMLTARRLVQVGGSFVLNCLGEADADATMKHFLKRFGAGADRFQVRQSFWEDTQGGHTWHECPDACFCAAAQT